jgi:hypothetical protein
MGRPRFRGGIIFAALVRIYRHDIFRSRGNLIGKGNYRGGLYDDACRRKFSLARKSRELARLTRHRSLVSPKNDRETSKSTL